jgi:signal transduction histidine kinase
MGELRRGILDHMWDRLRQEVHRTFVWLFLTQWLTAVVIALMRTPWTWRGTHRSLHPHVYMAIVLGSALCALPLGLIHWYPRRTITRHAVAAAQMLWSAMLIMVLGGRVEAHFHIFGSLAFLALYRDWKVIATATLVALADHVTRGVAWPDSIYGAANPEWWRFLEHAAWIVFEDVVLVVAAMRASRDMGDAAVREAALQQTAATVQRRVENRTRQLAETADRYRLLVENTEAIPFEYDARDRRLCYIAPKAARLLECEPAELEAADIVDRISHPMDRENVRAAIGAFMRGERRASAPIDHRLVTTNGRTIHVRTFLSGFIGDRIRGVMLDTTHQTQLESELRQAQKLESVGRLAAGVAHEINTPIQFVSDSLHFLRDGVADLLDVVRRQQAELEGARCGTWSAELAAETAASLDDADLPYLVDNLPHALDRALDGTQRVTTIVQSMKVFSHDKRELSEIDIKAALQATLTIARNEYKYVADLELQLEPVPDVMCFGSELNQVILNIVVNAAHAIAEGVAGTDHRGRITVALRRVGDSVQISISDTGTGIPEHARDHIFEQFYTTKPVGKGTGQGLALCRSVVVDKHHGSLTFETELGVGTTFHIQIPIVPPASAGLTSAA